MSLENRITVIEGPRLAGKSRIVQYLQKLNSDGSHQCGIYPVPKPKWFYRHIVKDVAFNYIKEFSFIEDPSEWEAFITGKEMALTQRINAHEESVLVDRYLITAAVYSHVFREFPVKRGETYLQEMNSIIDKDFANLKRRLRFFIILPDIDRALKEGVVGREGKDDLEDSQDKLQRQILLYTRYGLMMEEMGFKVKIKDSYHLDPDVARHIFEDLRDE